MGIQEDLINALRESSAWDSSAYILTYDESGGFFEHLPPPQLDADGLGIRIPTGVISPFAKKSHLEPTLYEHTSVLKFIETARSTRATERRTEHHRHLRECFEF